MKQTGLQPALVPKFTNRTKVAWNCTSANHYKIAFRESWRQKATSLHRLSFHWPSPGPRSCSRFSEARAGCYHPYPPVTQPREHFDISCSYSNIPGSSTWHVAGLLRVPWVPPKRAQASPVVGALGFVSNLPLGWGCRLLPEAVPFLFPCICWSDQRTDRHRQTRTDSTDRAGHGLGAGSSCPKHT